MSKEIIIKKCKDALAELQAETKSAYPMGAVVRAKRGRGASEMIVEGYPEPTGLAEAQTILARSPKGKVFHVFTKNILS
jgi:hypothetical protein